jgi:serine/threonine protein kinase
MNTDAMALGAGTTLGRDRYELEFVLGQGGFGITYCGMDRKLHRRVAIKEFFMTGSSRQGTTVTVPEHMRPQFEERMDRIRDEARVLARFRHPCIVTVHEYFEENDSIYVVMELLEGKSLRQVLEEAGGPLPEADVLRYGRDVGNALAAVHAENLLHRDVKPDNVMIQSDDQIVLVDFGTAREFATDQSSVMSQTLSPGYAPVEQYSDRARFGPSTDVYALGATLYHLATGTFPTPSLDRLVGQELPQVREVNPAMSEHTSQAIMWAMNVDAEDRPQTAGALVEVLEGAMIPEADDAATRIAPTATPSPTTVRPDAAATTPPQATEAPAAVPTPSRPSEAPTPTRKRRRRRSVRRGARRVLRTVVSIAITIAIAIGATFAVAWWFSNQSDDGNSHAPPAVAYEEGTPLDDGLAASSDIDPT